MANHQLRRIVEEAVRILQRDRIDEMSLSRANYKAHIGALFPQIVQNWVLVRLARDDEGWWNGCRNLNHWKGELKGAIKTAGSLNLKDGNRQKRYYTLLNEVEELEIRDPNTVFGIVSDKLDDEGVDALTNQYVPDVISQWCMDGWKDVVELIAYYDVANIDCYVRRL